MNIGENLTRYLAPASRLLAGRRLPVLLLAVARKARDAGQLRSDLQRLLGLCMAWWRGEYRAINAQALLSVVAGLVYFLTPLDAVPDWLLGAGLLDDLAVLAWIMRTWAAELQAYEDWRAQQDATQLQRIERLPAAG
ncbi:hypothetical protein A9179_05765 [Pseudomonas alcaligenes]|uniref:DUF1232 domain-containing protein n=1 Tax=Aquipseudomonas alcaligenes TaxID=43263 RepID=A0ABR7RWQ8_AQUAC|nr:DUF1232 domain-containing protein [Pseudomonas alcaligenes]MBC9249777.1 hypothetical protein [Pseudomonas alcaligenes]